MKIPKFLINGEFLDHLNIPIFVKDKNGDYIYCNSAFTKLIGKSPEQILNHTAQDILPPGLASIANTVETNFRDQAGSNMTTDKHDENANETNLAVKKWVIFDINHDISGFIGAIQTSSKTLDKTPSEFKRLTKRESEVLQLLAEGKSVKAIANILKISPHTATDHIKSIYLKLDVHSKNEAIYKMLPFLSSNDNPFHTHHEK